ncbi:hypothetical protein H6P81_019347 [Aristolochia fimbriata]|uniref:Nitrate regulatory gene2 protein-like n=1 Tax=Aristolochia fimbriata TaxID=158543 RepID=A0AAV7DV64_ARIFI|nr:hypothetical protein H6P81_019347 [Aristolochia fimbriata]
MGCTQSKIENEEVVSRCKERKIFMKEAVAARNAFAAAHSAYTMALKNTGAALSDYGQGEAHDTRPLPTPPLPQPDLPPPPPLPPGFQKPGYQTNLIRSSSMPEMVIPKADLKPSEPILEEEDGEDDAGPTISAPATPPPPPPPSSRPPSNPVPPMPEPQTNTQWDFFFAAPEEIPMSMLTEPEDTHKENHDSVMEQGHYDDIKRPDKGMSDSVSKKNENIVTPETPERVVESSTAVKPPKKQVQVNAMHQHVGPSESKRNKAGPSHVNLLHILNELDDLFLKASESAQEVSKMLEANRLHYHSNFADNRGHIDHSARVMRVITWNGSFKNMPNADDGKDDFDAEEETHATVLDKLLTWEKKLYDEVKAGELMKIEYQRKVALLNKQKKRNANSEAIEKTKAAVSHLHTRYIVDMQSMDSTVSEIQRLRDDQLYPKLVALVEAMSKMWQTMFVHHDHQFKLVVDLRGLDISNSPKETTDQHYEQTVQLYRIANEWRTQFENLMRHQKEYIQALNSWLKLNLIPIDSSLKEKVSLPPEAQHPPIQSLLHAWHEQLGKLPVELAKNAINSFGAVINSIITLQDDERKQKAVCEDSRKDHTRKSRSFEDWKRKYMEKHTPPDEMPDPDRPEENNMRDQIAERELVVEHAKKKLDDDIEVHLRLCRQVREKSLMSLKTHLPELFRTMTEFALESSDSYKKLLAINFARQGQAQEQEQMSSA